MLKEIGGGAGDNFYVVPLRTQNMCCRMNEPCFLTQVMCFAGLYQSVMSQKRPREQLGISLPSWKIQK